VNLESYVDHESRDHVYRLTIPERDLVTVRLFEWDRYLFDEVAQSASVADQLLALELLARRIEATVAQKKDSAT
jgi:hypothetical protein